MHFRKFMSPRSSCCSKHMVFLGLEGGVLAAGRVLREGGLRPGDGGVRRPLQGPGGTQQGAAPKRGPGGCISCSVHFHAIEKQTDVLFSL